MLYIDRRKEILETLTEHGSVKVNELARKYSVGEVTIRRDLKYLAQTYDIQLTYGGALISNDNVLKNIMEAISTRRTQNLEAKHTVAKKAVTLIEDGDTIALNSGSTAELVIDYLPDFRSLNLITLSLAIAAKASSKPFIDVYLSGGRLRGLSGTFYGSGSEEFLRKFSIDKAFFGVLAVTLGSGVTHPVLEEANVNKVLSQVSNKHYLLTDSSKFDKTYLAHMFELEMFDTFITDGQMPDAYREFANKHNIKVL